MTSGVIVLAVHLVAELALRNDWMFSDSSKLQKVRWGIHTTIYSLLAWVCLSAGGHPTPLINHFLFNIWHLAIHLVDIPSCWMGFIQSFGYKAIRRPWSPGFAVARRTPDSRDERQLFIVGRESVSHVLHLIPAWLLLC